MVKKYYILDILLLMLFGPQIVAQPIQRYNTFSYSVNEGLLQSTISNIAIDEDNFCWISFPIGIQKFDGIKFITIPIQQGLPDNKNVHFFKCSNGDLLISHSLGVSKYVIDRNGFNLIYKNAIDENIQAVFIGEDNGIIYFFTEKGVVKGIQLSTLKLITQTQTPIHSFSSITNYPVIFSDNIINHTVGMNVNSKIFLWNLKEGKVTGVSPTMPEMSMYLLRLKTDQEILYSSYKVNKGLKCYNFLTKKNRTIVINGKDDKQIGRCNILPWKKKALISFNNRLYETDNLLTSLKTELVDFQNLPVTGVSSISNGGIKEDNFGNLYIQTVNGGIRKIIANNYPLKYYGSLKKEDNNILSILIDKKNNRILAGAVNNGLLIFDTLQTTIKHIKKLAGNNLSFSPNLIIKNNNGDHLLFNSGENNAWLLNNTSSKKLPITSSLLDNKKGFHYFGNLICRNKDVAIAQTQGRLYKVNLNINTVFENEVSTAYIMGGLLHNNFIIIHGNDELMFIDTVSFSILKKIPFKNTGDVRCYAHDSDNNIFIGSNNGIYKIEESGKILEHFTKQNGLPDDCIYAMLFDDAGALWCSTNKGIFRLGKDKNIFVLKKEDGLQENEFNTNVAAKAEDGEMFFGGVNGISSFYPTSINKIQDSVRLFCTQIKVNNKEVFIDPAVWNINSIDLPYNQNSLSFDFVAMGNNNPDQYMYQYKMEGIDEQWLQNEDLQTVRYFLPPGKYIFKIFASRFFDKDAKPMKEIRIFIHPPFYKTWWFFSIIVFLIAGIMMYTLNVIAKNKYRKKLNEIKYDHKIQLERERISRDLHDSLGAYANAVLYNTALLEVEKETLKRSELMIDLKFAAKDIITSLRETVWALKKDNYSAEECLLRIKNFIHPLSKYYTTIHFGIETEHSRDPILFHSKALNVVRIVQEAVTNAIKHATAKDIIIRSNIDINNWEITISDDGKGFDYEKMRKEGQGNGLDNLKQRAIDSDMKLNIVSSENIGTTITLMI